MNMAPTERSAPRVLVLDSDAEHAEELVEQLRDAGYEANARADWDERDATLDIDVILGEADTVALEELAAACSPEEAPAWILLAAFGSIQDAVGAMRAGASDYISKPIPIDRLLMSLERALERRALLNQNQRLLEDLGRRYSLGEMQSTSDAMSSVFDTVRAVADTRATVLLEGESGTGKSLLARSLHEAGARSDGPFVVVNCGALPHDLLESELFGHKKGSFTGAVQDRKGHFVAADGGTVFLDEIGDMPLEMQAKLLRVLQDGEVRPVGSNEARRVDVRVVAASHRDLAAMCAAGEFREDLYYRLNVVTLEVPALRDRPGDLIHLITHFSALLTEELGRVVAVSEEARGALEAYGWPGNVRELENELRRAAVLSSGEIERGDLREEVGGG